MTIETNCPNCTKSIPLAIERNDFTDTLTKFLSAVHCETCYSLRASICLTEKRINHICELIRTSTGDPDLVASLENSLKGQHTAQRLLTKKLNARARDNNSPKVRMAPGSRTRLPW